MVPGIRCVRDLRARGGGPIGGPPAGNGVEFLSRAHVVARTIRALFTEYRRRPSRDGAPGPAAVQAKPALHAASPTVTIAVAKKPGENAVDIANRVIKRFKQLQGTYKLDGVEVAITRDYGAIADAKAKKLITKLGFFPSITDRSDAQRS